MAEAQAGRNPRGEADTRRPVSELAEQGPAELERVHRAKEICADLRATAQREAALRKQAYRKGAKMSILFSVAVAAICMMGAGPGGNSEELDAVYQKNPYAFLSRDYFARLSQDSNAVASADEITIRQDWSIIVGADTDPLVGVMAEDLAVFLRERMGLRLSVNHEKEGAIGHTRAVVLTDHDRGNLSSHDSFTIRVAKDVVAVQGQNAAGLRDGVVRLVDWMAFRAAPILPVGEEIATPRLAMRIGTVPRMGTYRDLVFMGYNGVIISPTDTSSATPFNAVSASRAIPELEHLHDPSLVQALAAKAREARRYGLKTYVSLSMWDFYPADAPIFANHPGLRGAEAYKHTDRPPAGYLLCTEDPLMRRYLAESIEGIFESIPLDGALIIVGGEEFPHCFMRPSGVDKGHTNCARCEILGAETVVANLCNGLAQAARKANPEAILVAWPYSAKYFWGADDDQMAFIEKLKPGTALLTEVEKDETLVKEGGVRKAIWDYSIDLIGPTERAKRQIAACKKAGVGVYLKSEPELAFEAAGLPYIPCVDRWFDRADALAASGADGAWVLAWFRPNQGTTSAEVYKYAWWNPAPDRETLLTMLAKRIAGSEKAAAHLRQAWKHVSAAIPWSPELPPYFLGPYYLGPSHPMCADPEAALPACFEAKSEFAAHVLKEARGDVEVFGRYYRNMERALGDAVRELDTATPDVPQRCRSVFEAEEWPTRWFYHTARTHANFYESCRLRSLLLAYAKRDSTAPEEKAEAQAQYNRWRAVLQDERQNTQAAITIVKRDSRLDVHNTRDGAALDPATDLMRNKLELLDHELNVFLPSLAAKCGLQDAR